MTHAVPPVSTPPRRAKDPRSPVPLRLVAFRGGIGIELYEPQRVGPIHIEELTWSLPGLSFPLDLSGGVRSFNRKRGLLQRVAISIGFADLEEWLSRRADNTDELGPLLRSVSVWPVDFGVGVGVSAERGSLAAEFLWAPDGENARFVVSHPRFVAQQVTPPLTHVAALVSRVLEGAARCNGRTVVFGPIGPWVVRQLLPNLGFRLPQATGLHCSSLDVRAERWMVTLDRNLPHWAAPAEVASALEFSQTALAGDQALIAGDWNEARRAYVTALETAPRHPELSQTIASIDAQFEERVDAPLGLLVESLPAVEFGLVGAQLLARTGDYDGARLAVSKLANRERFAPLAAAYWLKLSEWLTSIEEQVEAIDLALAASTGSTPARWARFQVRVRLGDVNGAVADAEHLEAAARGADARHAVLVQAAGQLSDAGFVEAAGRLYERSLRYSPADPRSSLGVAMSLVASGKQERALVLLQRTAELADDDETTQSQAHLALGQLLADYVGDLPQAINRVRRVKGLSDTAVEARGYEAVWRARLGDQAGATIAFSRLSDTINASPVLSRFRAAKWLIEAGRFAAEQAGDDLSAERYLGHALRLAPKDESVLEAYRKAARRLQGHKSTPHSDSALAVSALDKLIVPAAEPPSTNVNIVHPSQLELSERDIELQVEELKAQLMATRAPGAQLVDALADGLHRLGKDEEAYALLQAQLDDASGAARVPLEQALRRVLGSLIDAARDADEPDDVELYQLGLERLRNPS